MRNIKGALGIAVALGLCVTALAPATERHVPSEYPTIQAAIDASANGDTVLVADGTYTGAGNKNLDFGGKGITVRSASGDPAACVIDCDASGRGFYFHSGETAASIVQDMTIRNGNVTGDGGGVYCDSSSPTLSNCTIAGNVAYYGGGGVYCTYSSPTLTDCMIAGNTADHGGGGVFCEYSSSPTLTNCMIAGNTADHTGGGVFCYVSSSPTLTNCTITGNTADYGNGGGMYCYDSSSPTLTNCILWANTAQQISVYSGSPVVTYCDVQGGWSGTGNIDGDPLFRDPDGLDNDPNTFGDNDYRLSYGSPCIDAGDNAAVPADMADLDGDGDTQEPTPWDLDGWLRFIDDPNTPDTGSGDPPVVDMGAFEFRGGLRPGDLNCDGTVDFGDINPFVLYLSNYWAWLQTYMDCPPENGDINGDGTYRQASFGDINPFVDLLTGG